MIRLGINSSGAVIWAADGIVVCSASNSQYMPVIIEDDLGGAIIAWGDYRGGSDLDIYAQRVSAGGTVQCGGQQTQFHNSVASMHDLSNTIWQRKILVGVGEPCNQAVPFTSRACSDFHVGGIAVTRYIFQIIYHSFFASGIMVFLKC